MPMFYKTWRHPRSETPLFYIGGVAAPLLSVIASPSYQYAVLVFPLYLALANVVQLGIMYRHTLVVRA
ncbi:MAG TPA: hypothetical protein VMY99_05460 [Nevskiaceae bacterium]|nr:hypothetical protein [Nevskiaceae bacterium]